MNRDLENQLAIEPNAADVQRGATVTALDRRGLITVKEAARALGKSRSTIYRMDRESGPFRFVAQGRRVFIDANDFHAYLEHTHGREAADSVDTAALSLPKTSSETTVETTTIETDTGHHHSSGQRELVVPNTPRVNVTLVLC